MVVFLIIGFWLCFGTLLVYAQHRFCEVDCAIADFCYAISTGKDPE